MYPSLDAQRKFPWWGAQAQTWGLPKPSLPGRMTGWYKSPEFGLGRRPAPVQQHEGEADAGWSVLCTPHPKIIIDLFKFRLHIQKTSSKSKYSHSLVFLLGGVCVGGIKHSGPFDHSWDVGSVVFPAQTVESERQTAGSIFSCFSLNKSLNILQSHLPHLWDEDLSMPTEKVSPSLSPTEVSSYTLSDFSLCTGHSDIASVRVSFMC